MKQGAADFVTKPWENERLLATLLAASTCAARARGAELRNRNRGLAAATRTESEMIGTSAPTLRVFDTIRRAAPTDANVLILGENGTGKELVAREIHRHSHRAEEVFLRVDLGRACRRSCSRVSCSDIVAAPLPTRRTTASGCFAPPTGGTLFLDEIGNVPLHLQSKLLTALERREITPVGTDKPEPIDVRLICATNLAPERLADANMFRHGPPLSHQHGEIVLPPLRERREDIPLLLEHFIAIYAQKYNFAPSG